MPTVASDSSVNLPAVAAACGYPYTASVDNFADLDRELEAAKARGALSLIEIKCQVGARDDLGRPTTTALENKNNFMEYING
jgi:phosphonopyruvate decarboxylase